jgi:hypothetical protein
VKSLSQSLIWSTAILNDCCSEQYGLLPATLVVNSPNKYACSVCVMVDMKGFNLSMQDIITWPSISLMSSTPSGDPFIQRYLACKIYMDHRFLLPVNNEAKNLLCRISWFGQVEAWTCPRHLKPQLFGR